MGPDPGRSGGPAGRDAALAEPREERWQPLYSCFRRKGHDAEASRDHVRKSFAMLPEPGDVTAADRIRGGFART